MNAKRSNNPSTKHARQQLIQDLLTGKLIHDVVLIIMAYDACFHNVLIAQINHSSTVKHVTQLNNGVFALSIADNVEIWDRDLNGRQQVINYKHATILKTVAVQHGVVAILCQRHYNQNRAARFNFFTSVWDTHTNTELSRFYPDLVNHGAVDIVALPSGHLALSNFARLSVRDIHGQLLQSTHHLNGGVRGVAAVADTINATNATNATSTDKVAFGAYGTVYIWDTSTPVSRLGTHRSLVTTIASLPDNLLASCCARGEIYIWNLITSLKLKSCNMFEVGATVCMMVHSFGALVTLASDCTIKSWSFTNDAHTTQDENKIYHREIIALANGAVLSCANKTIAIYN